MAKMTGAGAGKKKRYKRMTKSEKKMAAKKVLSEVRKKKRKGAVKDHEKHAIKTRGGHGGWAIDIEKAFIRKETKDMNINELIEYRKNKRAKRKKDFAKGLAERKRR